LLAIPHSQHRFLTLALPLSTVPNRGAAHPMSDYDLVRGGDGDDIIIGNEQLDQLFGDSGNDVFFEPIEVRDLLGVRPYLHPQAGKAVRCCGRLREVILVEDDVLAGLQVAGLSSVMMACTRQLPMCRCGVTRRFDGGFEINGRILESQLAAVTELNAASLGITDLTGVAHLTSLKRPCCPAMRLSTCHHWPSTGA
jgi:Ca2+-binding RTX toxin-like protein